MEEICIRTAKIMQQRVIAAYRIRDIAADFGTKLPADFELNHFLDLPIELLSKIVVKLMATKCTSLRREEEDMMVLMLPALQLYLGMRPRKVDLTAFLSFCPKLLKYQYLKMSVICISEKAADIEELSLLAIEADPFFRFFPETADDELLQALEKLKRLKVLRIEEICKIYLIHMIKLCQNLPNLEYLQFNIKDDEDQLYYFQDLNWAEKLKNAMPKLQVFLYFTEQYEMIPILFKSCTENLPNLRVIREFSSSFSTFEDYESSSQTIACASGTSNLRHLEVAFYDVDDGHVDLSHLPSAFPLITHLEICWSNSATSEARNLTALLQLTHLESLQFVNVPQDIFHLFMEKFGPNLRAIHLNYDEDSIRVSTEYSLGQLLALCPKLERLSFAADFKEDPEPITFFSNLKEVRMDFWCPYENDHIRLTDILGAPNLEKITLLGECIDFEQLRRVSTLVGEKKILGNLKELHFIAHASSSNNFLAGYFKEIAAFIKCVAASLATIRVITFDLQYRHTAGYAALARSLAIGKTTNDEIVGITEFFQFVQYYQNLSSEFVELFVDEELIAILQQYSR